MAKPIVVLYLPTSDHLGPNRSAGELMAIFNGHDDTIKMAQGFYDYLWFVFINEELVAPELKVFHEKDFTEIQYDELNKILQEGIESLKNKSNG